MRMSTEAVSTGQSESLLATRTPAGVIHLLAFRKPAGVCLLALVTGCWLWKPAAAGCYV